MGVGALVCIEIDDGRRCKAGECRSPIFCASWMTYSWCRLRHGAITMSAGMVLHKSSISQVCKTTDTVQPLPTVSQSSEVCRTRETVAHLQVFLTSIHSYCRCIQNEDLFDRLEATVLPKVVEIGAVFTTRKYIFGTTTCRPHIDR